MVKDLRILALACVLLGGMGQGVVAPKLPELLKESTRLAFDSGISATVMYFGIFISTFRFGKWADQGRVHWLLGPGMLIYSLVLVALGYLSTPMGFFIGRFAEGISLSAVYVAADFILGRLSGPKERGQWLSYYGVALSIGLLAGPAVALGAAKIGISSSPIFPLCIVAGLAAVMGLVVMRARVQKAPDHVGPPSKLNPRALASGSAYGYMEAGLVAVMPILAVKEFHVLPEYCLFFVIIAAALSSVVWGIASDKKGPKPVALILLSLLMVGPFVMLGTLRVFTPEVVAFSSCVLFGILAGGLYPVAFSWLLLDLPESQYGYASGGFARAYGLGSIFGPLLTGLASENLGAQGFFLSMGITGALGLGYVLLFNRTGTGKVEIKPLS